MTEIDKVDGTIIAIIIANLLVSNRGFRDENVKEPYLFDVNAILRGRELHRLFTSGFLRIAWGHLAVNMFTVFFLHGWTWSANVGKYPRAAFRSAVALRPPAV